MLTSKIKIAFNILLDKILGYSDQDEITVIYDESFKNYLTAFTSLINERGILTNFFFLPYSYQKMLIQRNSLSRSIRASFSEADIFFNVINGSKETTALRKLIIQESRNESSRLAHMPNIDDNLLKLIIDSEDELKEIKNRSEKIAWALGQSEKIEIISKDHDEKEYCLTIEARYPWLIDPIVSPGVIEKGSWGNPIPGETFICPSGSYVNGDICINGSIPNCVLKKEENIIMTFQKGRLIKSTSNGRLTPGKDFLDIEEARAMKSGDKDWNCFAELGIGLNGSIKSLTGNMLYDEKMYGTIHIAIGDNKGFGFEVSATVHHDMVVTSPKIRCNGVYEIIQDGQIAFPIIDKWKNSFKPQKLIIDSSDEIRVNYQKLLIKNDLGLLKISRAGRDSFLTIFNKNKVGGLKNILKLIGEGQGIQYSELIKRYKSESDINSLLEILSNYKIIMVQKSKAAKP